MVVKRKSKDPERVSLPRRTKRCPKFRCKVLLWSFVPRKPMKNDTHITNLPDELLINVFRYFNTKELYYILRHVCRRWMVLAMSPILWKEIDVKNDIPTNTLTDWIKTSPLLKRFSIENRDDSNIITEQLARNCKHLESLTMQNCRGSPNCCVICSTPLCSLVTRCTNLCNYNFTKSRFYSRKFFRLITQDNGKNKRNCNYTGPVTLKQIMGIFLGLPDYEANVSATIGNYTQKCKVREIIKCYQDLRNPRDIMDVWENLIDDPMQMDDVWENLIHVPHVQMSV